MEDTIQDYFIFLQAEKENYISCPFTYRWGHVISSGQQNMALYALAPKQPHTKYQVTVHYDC